MIHSRRLVLFFFIVVAAIATAKSGDPDYLELRRMIGREQFPEALERCKELLGVHPDDVALYETLAEVAQYAGNLDEAIGFFTRNIEQGNRPGLCHFGLGTVAYYTNDFQSAVLELTKAIECGVEAPECYKLFEYSHEKVFGVESTITFLISLRQRHPENPNCDYALALAYWGKHEFEKAISHLDGALRAKPSQLKFLVAKVACAYLDGNPKSSLQQWDKIKASLAKEQDFEALLFLRSYEVIVEIGKKNWADARNDVTELLLDARDMGCFRWIGWGYKRLADIEFITEKYDRALDATSSALEASARCKDVELTFATLTRRFECLMELGDFAGALDCLQMKLRTHGIRDLDYDAVRTLSDLAWVHHELGQRQVALDYGISALAKVESSGSNQKDYFRIQSILGMIYEGSGNYTAAMDHYRRSWSVLPLGETHDRNRAITHGNLGRACLNLGRITEAKRHFLDQLNLAERCGYRREQAYAHSNLGEYHWLRNDPVSSRLHYTRALAIGRDLSHKPTTLLALRGLARIEEGKNDYNQALALFSQSNDLSKRMGLRDGRRTNTSILKGISSSDAKDLFRVLCKAGRLNEAFENRELMMKSEDDEGFAALNSLAPDISSDVLRERLVDIRGKIDRKLHFQAKEFGNKPIWQTDQTRFLSLQNDINSLEVEFGLIMDSIRASRAKNPIGSRDKVISLRILTDSILTERSAFLSYVVDSRQTTGVCVTLDSQVVFHVPITREQLNQKLSELSPIFGTGVDAPGVWNSTLANFSMSNATELFDLLVKPIYPVIKHKSRLLISPDEMLKSLPFEMLVISKNCRDFSPTEPNDSLMLFKYEMSYIFSASMLHRNRVASQASRLLLALGNPKRNSNSISSQRLHDPNQEFTRQPMIPPLPGSEDEVQRIYEALGSNGDVLLRGDATEAAFKSVAGNYRIIHVAAHSVYDQFRPIHSALCLSENPSSSDDGDLHAFELLTMKLHAELAVLSACNTAGTAYSRGMEGFARAIYFSGVPSVVAALWSIDDNTTTFLMDRFYRYVAQGRTLSQALQMAKVDLYQSGKTDPYYWAAFVLIGDDSALPIDVAPGGRPTVTTMLSTFSILLAMTAIAVSRHRWVRLFSLVHKK